MGNLAINGGKAMHPTDRPWPEWPIPDEREVELVTEVVRSGAWFSGGEKTQRAQELFAKFVGCQYALTAVNGTLTIEMALEALDIGAYDEVIVPGNTFQGTVTPVINVNAVPIIVDVDPETYCLSPDAVRAAITDRTRAILPVHLFGAMCDMDEIMEIAQKHNLAVIEDCAHSHGSRWRNQGAGAIGDIGSFSFCGKPINIAEGGMLTTNKEVLWLKLLALRNCGRKPRPDAPLIQGYTRRMSEYQAAILVAALEKADERIDLWDENAQHLNSLMAQVAGVSPVKRFPQITRQSYYAYVLRYSEPEWHDVPVQTFRRALSAEIGEYVIGGYALLTDGEDALYYPRTKRRHHLNEEYWQAIDPTRFDLPVCRHALDHEMCVISAQVLKGSRADAEDVARAITKLRENLAELKASVLPEDCPKK